MKLMFTFSSPHMCILMNCGRSATMHLEICLRCFWLWKIWKIHFNDFLAQKFFCKFWISENSGKHHEKSSDWQLTLQTLPTILNDDHFQHFYWSQNTSKVMQKVLSRYMCEKLFVWFKIKKWNKLETELSVSRKFCKPSSDDRILYNPNLN